jgi:hypothetical protein
MEHPIAEKTREPLEIFIAYDSLPAIQAAAVLHHVGITYDIVLSRFPRLGHPLPSFDFDIWEKRPREAQFYGPQISVETAVTGESIRWGFGPPKQLLPKLTFEHEDLKVLLPRWTAAAALAGAVLIGGLHTYHEILEVIKVQSEVREQLRPIDHITAQAFENERRLFQESLSTQNIRAVFVNGVPIVLQTPPNPRRL